MSVIYNALERIIKEIKIESVIANIIFVKIRKLIEKHKTFINWYKNKFKLSDYQLLWLVFLKGVLITIIFSKIF